VRRTERRFGLIGALLGTFASTYPVGIPMPLIGLAFYALATALLLVTRPAEGA
jgi:hypothetical protein